MSVDAATEVVVIGAGLAGLTAARILVDAGVEVVVLDKSRGVGGRMATRRIGDAVFDHGAQFFTAKGELMTAAVERWEEHGWAEPWFEGHLGDDGSFEPDGHTRWRAVPSMTGVAKGLVEGLDVRREHRVGAIHSDEAGWRLSRSTADGAARWVSDTESDISAQRVLITAPVPQLLDMTSGLELTPAAVSALEPIEYDPCLAVLVVCAGPSRMGRPGAMRFAEGPVEWVGDNQVKGISPVPAVTIHLSPEASASHFDDHEAAIDVALDTVGHLLDEPGEIQVHGWRYSRPSVTHPEPHLVLDPNATLIASGDAFGGPRVEGALVSGASAAHRLLGTGTGQS